MGLFGKSFKDKVQDALTAVRAGGIAVTDLDARVDGKVVTLTGTAATMEDKVRAMEAFNAAVATANTVNQIRVEQPPAAVTAPAATDEPETPATAEAEAEETIHEVVSGDTLGAIAQRYYGKASLYMKIFEANRDQLDNPNLIKVGQKLRIPKP